MAVDFVLSLVVFVAMSVLAIQFVGSAANPMITSEGTAIETHNVGDRLYYERLSANGDGGHGVVNLSYFANASGDIRNESNISDDLNVDADGVNITVKEADGDDLVKLNGENISIGRNPPDKGTKVSGVDRVGYTQTNGTVVIEMRMW